MSRINREPEYRRRIREKAEKEEQKSADERQETAKRADIHEIVAAIKAIDQKYDRESHKHNTRHKWDRLWEVLGVMGLWIAAAVGIAAIYIGTHDASEQRGVMQGQLAEMRNARKSNDKSTADQLKIMSGQLNQFDIGQRPWVRLTVANPRYLLVQESGVIIDLEFRANNVGHSPAEGVYTTGKVFPNLSLTEQNTAARAVCDGSRAIFEDNPYGKNLEHLRSIIFPNEERQIQEVGGLIVRTDEIIQSKLREIDFQYSGSIPYIGKEQADARREKALAELKTKPIFSA